MSIVAFAGGEEGIVTDGIGSTTGTCTISTTQAKSGSYSYKAAPVTTGTGGFSVLAPDIGAGGNWKLQVLTAMADAYANTWIYWETLPSAEEEICRMGAGATMKLKVRITSGGILKVYDRLDALVSTGSTALSTGTWCNIGVRAGNGASAAYAVTINGTTELSGTASQGASNVSRVQWGKITDTNGSGYVAYFDDCIVDNAAFNPTVVSNFSTTTANGSVMSWTGGTGGGDYTQVNEVPRSQSNYVMSTGGAGQVARFAFPSMSTRGISGATIKALYCGNWVRENTGTTTSTQIRMVSGATTTDSVAFDPTTTGEMTYGLFLTDPNTGSAWTETNINAAEFGAIENNAVSTRMTWCGAYILYIPAATTTSGNFFQLFP